MRTTCIFSFSRMEYENRIMEQVNKFFGKEAFIPFDDLIMSSSWYDELMLPGAPLYLGTFDYFDLKSFIDYVTTITFVEPYKVQLITKIENEDSFDLINIFQG